MENGREYRCKDIWIFGNIQKGEKEIWEMLIREEKNKHIWNMDIGVA